MKKTLVILTVVLALIAGVLMGYVLVPKLWSQPVVIAQDSFVLRSRYGLSQEEQRELDRLTAEMDDNPYWYQTTGLPLNRFGMYFDGVFLEGGDVVKVIIRSQVPLGYSQGRDILVHFVSDSGVGVVPVGQTISDYVDHERANGDWQLSFSYTARASESHWLYIYNTTPKDVWCEYVVLLDK